MIDEHKLLRDNARSAQAKDLLDNALFNEALEAIEADLIAKWKNMAHQEQREECWRDLKAAGRLKGYFESVLSDGKLAAAQLKQLAEDAERNRRFSI